MRPRPPHASDARPSDSIAPALKTKSLLYAEESLFVIPREDPRDDDEEGDDDRPASPPSSGDQPLLQESLADRLRWDRPLGIQQVCALNGRAGGSSSRYCIRMLHRGRSTPRAFHAVKRHLIRIFPNKKAPGTGLLLVDSKSKGKAIRGSKPSCGSCRPVRISPRR